MSINTDTPTYPFSQELTKNLIDVLARLTWLTWLQRNSCVIETIRTVLITRISHYELLSNLALAAVTLMNSRIPSVHKAWWQRKSLDELHKLYMELTATPAKVLLQVICTETSNLAK